MPSVKVYNNSPGKGPGNMESLLALDNINKAHATWHVTRTWTTDDTVFTSATASEKDLETAVKAELKGYQYVAYDLTKA